MALNIQEAERAVISLLLAEPECQEEILAECLPEMFIDPDCRRILLTAQELKTEEMPIDLTTLSARTETAFAPKLVEISQTVCVLSALQAYLAEIKKAWQFRVTSAKLMTCLEKARNHDESCYSAMEELFGAAEMTGKKEELPVTDLSDEAARTFFDKETGLSTGFHGLDLILGGGIMPGRLMVLGGRPGMGKSAMALNIALQAAKVGAVVLYISLEMTAKELTKRALSMLSGVDPYKDFKQRETAQEKIVHAGKELMPTKLYLRDGGDTSLASVLAACRRIKAKEGKLDLVVIDYVGLMRTERTNTSTRQQEIAQISRGLKQLAIRMPTCVLLLSQLNRAADARLDSIPHLSDLRECGDLEQDADVVLFPVRPCNFESAPADKSTAVLYIAKNRSGRPGKIEMEWHGGTYTFRERAAVKKA